MTGQPVRKASSRAFRNIGTGEKLHLNTLMTLAALVNQDGNNLPRRKILRHSVKASRLAIA